VVTLTTAIIALGVNGAAYAVEIIHGGVGSIGKGQIDAGYWYSA
jgi:polar amino acid transport system permease protein